MAPVARLLTLISILFICSCGSGGNKGGEVAQKAQIFQALLAGLRFDGVDLAGGKIYFYAPGTTTLKAIYVDSDKTTEAANPYDLDANGQAEVFGDGVYDIKVTTPAGVQKAYWENVAIVDVTSSQTYKVRDYASLNAAVSVIGATESDLEIENGDTSVLTGNLTIPSNIRIVVKKGGAINQGAYTLTINGQLDSGRYSIFANTGSVVLGAGCVESVFPEWFGAIGTAYNDTSKAAANYAAITKAVASIAATGGTVSFAPIWYYVNNAIVVTTNGIRFVGNGSSATALSQGSHIGTTSTTSDVIQVNDSVDAVEGFEISNIVIHGNASGTTGNGINIIASNARAISKIVIKNSAFNYCAENGIQFKADVASSFIFNSNINDVLTVGNKKNGVFITGQCSQFGINSLYTENNTYNGVYIYGGTLGGTNSISFNKLTLSVVPDGYAGLNVEWASAIDVRALYTEDVAGDNIRLRSVTGFTAIGGAMQQVASTSYGVVIGVDASNRPNKNHYIDIPGWTNASLQKHVDLTRYTGGVVVDNLILGITADGPLTTSMVNGYGSTFYLNRIIFLYQNYDNGPTIEVQSSAGTGATISVTTGATDKRGRFTLTHGTASWASGPQVRVTFADPKAVAPFVTVQPESTTSGTQSQTNGVVIESTTTHFDLTFSTAIVAQPAFPGIWSYTVMD